MSGAYWPLAAGTAEIVQSQARPVCLRLFPEHCGGHRHLRWKGRARGKGFSEGPSREPLAGPLPRMRPQRSAVGQVGRRGWGGEDALTWRWGRPCRDQSLANVLSCG